MNSGKPASRGRKKGDPPPKSLFGRRLLAVFSGKKKAEIQDILGCSHSALGEYLSGKTLPNGRALERVALKHGIDLNYLLGIEKAPAAGQGQGESADAIQVKGLAPPPDGCPNHGVCASFGTLLQLLGAAVSVSATESDPTRRAEVIAAVEEAAERIRRLPPADGQDASA